MIDGHKSVLTVAQVQQWADFQHFGAPAHVLHRNIVSRGNGKWLALAVGILGLGALLILGLDSREQRAKAQTAVEVLTEQPSAVRSDLPPLPAPIVKRGKR